MNRRRESIDGVTPKDGERVKELERQSRDLEIATRAKDYSSNSLRLSVESSPINLWEWATTLASRFS
jgi:hypothetical protein